MNDESKSVKRRPPSRRDDVVILDRTYVQLRRVAANLLAREAACHTLQPTALVHEAWIRLGADQQPNWSNRTHFFSAASEAMRRILVERARHRQRIRHGGGKVRVDFHELAIAAPAKDETILQINELLDGLNAEHPSKAELVKLKFFVGLKDREVAELMGITERTVERHWAYARAWLFSRIHRDSNPVEGSADPPK